MRSVTLRGNPRAIGIWVNIDSAHWLARTPRDTRSSLWRPLYHSFRAAKWTNAKKPERRQYLKNAYRVLLARARQGMVIFVPPRARRDRTRSPAFYGRIYDYLTGCGVARL